MTHSLPTHVVVVGGGIFGTSTAAQLEARGIPVTLLTEGALASGASGRSLAWLNSAADWSWDYHALRLAGIDRWRTWAAGHPGSERYLRFTGGLMWAGRDESLKALFEAQRSKGYDARWLSRDDVQRVAGGVDAGAVAAEGAIFNPGEGWVDLPTVIRILASQIAAGGGRIEENVRVAEVIVEDGRVAGVLTTDGARLESDAVVLATGPAVPRQLAELGVEIGEPGPAAFVAFTKPVDSELEMTLNTPRVAIRRTLDGGLAMDSAWSEEAIVFADDGTLVVRDEVISELLEEGRAVLAGHPQLELDRIGAGYKPVPADGLPVHGAVQRMPGLYVSFSHSGATQGLITGELMAEEVATGFVSPLWKSFRVERLAAVSAA